MQKNRSKKYSKEEIKFIKENYAGTRQCVEKIALTLDRTTASINKKIYNLCLGERKKVETCCEEEKLTQREEEVYKELLKGGTSKEIARDLNIEVSTLNTHRNAILHKKGVNSLNELLAKKIKEMEKQCANQLNKG